MTSKNTPRIYDSGFLNAASIVDDHAIISKALNSRTISEKARKAQASLGLEGILIEKDPSTKKPIITLKELNKLSEEEKTELLRNYASERAILAMQEAVNRLAKNPDNILKDNKTRNYTPKLESIALTEPLVNNADPKYHSLIQLYSKRKELQEIVANYEKNGQLNLKPEDAEAMRESIAQRTYKERYKLYLKSGFSEIDAEQAAKLSASRIMAGGSLQEEIKEGIKEQLSRIDNEIKERYGKTAETAIRGYVADTIKNMAKSGDRKKEETAASLVYKALTGKAIGEGDPAPLIEQYLNRYEKTNTQS